MPGPQARWNTVPVSQLKPGFYGAHLYFTIHAKCMNGANCTGPGCRVNTGKTRRNG